MARKSRKGVSAPAQPKKGYIKIWRTALYIRLSVEFNGKRGDSLETQRQIMEAYAALCPDLEIVEVYTDNGITGRTFEREAFQRMLADVEVGKINCIMVKDLSRLGRNTIDTGYYIEKYFPLHGVRFIAVNDQFDSEYGENSGNHLIVPLKNMINEAYAADISKKVRAQQNQAMRDGEFVGARPPYGYRKDPDNCHRLLVNEDTAPIVRQIFQWIADGVALNEVVKRLNASGALSPGAYQASIGLVKSKRLIGGGNWNAWGVGKLLTDAVYTGDMVQGKHTNVGHKQVPTKPEDWIIVRGTHEPIISRELFDRVQSIRRQTVENAKASDAKKNPYTENIFRGRIFCGHCGRPLNRHRDNQQGSYSFSCIANQRMGKGACSRSAYIREDKLFSLAMTFVCQQAEIMMGEALRLKQCDGKIAAQKARVDQEIAELGQQTQKNKAIRAGLYENFVKGILTRAEYLEMQENYSQKIRAAVERVQQLQAEQSELERQMERFTSMADKLAAAVKDMTLSALLVNQLIERATVNGPNDVSIKFSFDGGFERVMEVLGNE